MRDEDVRAASMAHLAILAAEFGEDIPYAVVLRAASRSEARVPFLNRQKGIYRAAIQRGLPRRRSRRLKKRHQIHGAGHD